MGTLLLWGAALLFTAAAAVSFAASLKKVSRLLFITALCFQGAALALLAAAFLTHDFSIEYVRLNSSRGTPFIYLISGVWAGQEGSFLLWSLMTSFVSVSLLKERSSGAFKAAAVICAVFAAVSAFAANPFAHGASASDGLGLKTILRNPWMAVHPPVLFLGYALTLIPFSRMLDAVIRRDLSVLTAARKEVILIAAVLGAGIALGGIWAYETLGWGGFWGWDPVENSSLVPWILTAALVHINMLQDRKGHWEKTVFFLSVSLFVLVLFSAFLTRSGLLSAVSVHSFGRSALALPLGFMTCCAVIAPAAVFVFRGRKLFSNERRQEDLRDIIFGTGVTTVIFYGFIILAVTMAPLVMIAFGQPPVSVKISFYSNITLVFSAIFLLTIALSIPQTTAFIGKRARVFIVIVSAGVFIFAFLGVKTLSISTCIAVGAAGAVVALSVISLFSKSWLRRLPQALCHAGLAFFVAGSISFSIKSYGERKELPVGKETFVSGSKVTFRGTMETGRNGFFLVDFNRGEKSLHAEIPYEKLEDGSIMSVSPYIDHGIYEDLYLFVEGYLSKADIDRIAKTELVQAPHTDTVLLNLSRKIMLLPVFLGALLVVTGAFCGFILFKREQ
jgi:cytochrome c-type biogenesis protein CcmF